MRLFKKIAVLSAAVLLVPATVRPAEFVKYSEARPRIEEKAPAAGSVTGAGLKALLEKGAVRVFDARSKNEFDWEHIAGAQLPHGDAFYKDVDLFRQKIVREAPNTRASLERSTRDIPRDAAIVTYCSRNCGLSKSLKMELERLGFTDVRWLEGGIDDWREKGYPLERNNP